MLTKNPTFRLGLFFSKPFRQELRVPKISLIIYKPNHINTRTVPNLDLKYFWYQSPADAGAILRIAGQALGQEFFFVEDPPDEKRQHDGQAQKAPVGAQAQRRAQAIEERAGVHGVADDGVRPGRDHFLVAGDLDGRCRIAIDTEDEEDDDPADDEAQIADDRQPCRNIRPVPAPVKPWDQDEAGKTQAGEEHDHFFRGPLFGCGAAAGPPCE